MDKLRMGLIGFGNVALKHHFPAYQALAARGAPIELVAVSSLEEVSAPGMRCHLDWREMIEREELHAVDICLPTCLHEGVACACLEAGLHVLCEKPMALSEASGQRMIDASRRVGKLLMVAMPLRFYAPYLLIERLVQEGSLGAPRRALFTRSLLMPREGWMLDPALSGGATLDVMIHDVDACQWLFGEPQGVSCTSQALPSGAACSASARLTYADGRYATLIADWLPYYNKHAIRTGRVDFERGYLWFDLERRRLDLVDAQGAVHDHAALIDDPMYQNEIDYFVQCALTGASPARCPPEHSLRAVGLCSLANQP